MSLGFRCLGFRVQIVNDIVSVAPMIWSKSIGGLGFRLPSLRFRVASPAKGKPQTQNPMAAA